MIPYAEEPRPSRKIDLIERIEKIKYLAAGWYCIVEWSNTSSAHNYIWKARVLFPQFDWIAKCEGRKSKLYMFHMGFDNGKAKRVIKKK